MATATTSSSDRRRRRHYLITGGSEGIGAALVSQLVATEQNPKISIVGRSRDKFDKYQKELLTNAEQRQCCLTFYQYDLSLMHEVKALAAELEKSAEPLHAIVHCAGVMLPQRTVTKEGLETVFALQFLARFYLNHLLAPLLLKNSHEQEEKPVVVVVSAGGSITRHPSQLDWDNLQGEKSYNGVHALKHESIANDMQMLRYQQLHPKIEWYCYGPGYVGDTQLLAAMPTAFRWMAGMAGHVIGISAQQAAKNIMLLLVDDGQAKREETNHQSVLYQRGLKAADERKIKRRMQTENQEKLFRVSQELLKTVDITIDMYVVP
ncbi:Dehydrogenase reductase SDR family member [Seminavis robusta]|uniref:Dehydrogenase reductase SDR family member n=1 Tax=Seminavis robusta TaxID=568900 RepID=A0A9N8H916_9STRA|nr:Dehydrogenase reductase SDR family member [Seminavis robusta]|eukprot:Sro176_g077400.1 Dehydrogenase reductase SDR family member (321) ;mRNA; f:54263-55225